METPKLICKKLNCDIKDCPYHHETLTNYSIPHNAVHLYENPLYCKKNNWHRNQTKTPHKWTHESKSTKSKWL